MTTTYCMCEKPRSFLLPKNKSVLSDTACVDCNLPIKPPTETKVEIEERSSGIYANGIKIAPPTKIAIASTETKCCDSCFDGDMFGAVDCDNPSCPCHIDKVLESVDRQVGRACERLGLINVGAKDFNDRFLPVMRELAEEEGVDESGALDAFHILWTTLKGRDSHGKYNEIKRLFRTELSRAREEGYEDASGKATAHYEKVCAERESKARTDLLQELLKEVEGRKETLPNYARRAQNRNGLYYCSNCEQAWEDCSCAARNTGHVEALSDLATSIRERLGEGDKAFMTRIPETKEQGEWWRIGFEAGQKETERANAIPLKVGRAIIEAVKESTQP